MSAQPQPEQTQPAETSIDQVSENIAAQLQETLANVNVKLVDGKPQINPTHKIVHYYVGAERQEENRPGIREDESKVGRENAVKIGKLLKDQLQSDDETFALTDPIRNIFYAGATSPLTTIIAKNQVASDVMKNSSESQSFGRVNVARFSEKGIPDPVGRAIIWATARATTQIIDKEISKAAELQDDQYVQSADDRLTGEIKSLQLQLNESRQALAESESAQRPLNERVNEAKAITEKLERQINLLNLSPRTVGEKIKPAGVEQAVKEASFH